MMIAGPVANAISEASHVHVTALFPNKDCEDLGSWVGGVRASDEAYQGTYSWSCDSNTAYLEATNWQTEWQGKKFIMDVWLHCDATADCAVSLDDGVTNTASGTYSTAAWKRFTLAKTLDASASRLRIIFREFGATGAAHIDAVNVYSPLHGAGEHFANFNDELYSGHANQLVKVSSAGDGYENVFNFPANITHLEPFVNDDLYIALNTSNAYWIMNTAEGFREVLATPQVNCFEFFELVQSANPTMWGNNSNFQIKSTTTPETVTSWSGVTNVSSSFHNITDLLEQTGALYIMKENRPYYLDSSGAVQDDLAPELDSLTSSTSGHNSFVWKKKVYIPCGDQGLLETDGTTNRFISPALFCTNLPQMIGRIMAVAGDEEFLYVAVDYGNEVEVVAGREETIHGTTDWVWHPIAETTLEDVDDMAVSTVVSKRLWLSATSSTDNPWAYLTLPIGYGDITGDVNYKFQTNTFVESPWLHANFKDTQKSIIKLTSSLGHVYDPDVFFQVHYKTLTNSSYTFAGNAAGTPTSMTNTLFIPTTPVPTDTMFRFKFTANTNNTDLTPLMHSYVVQALLYPPKRNIISCQVRGADNMTLKDGNTEISSSDTIKKVMNEARKATWPMTFYDIDGDVRYVRLLPMTDQTKWNIIRDEKGREIERVYNLLLQEVELS